MGIYRSKRIALSLTLTGLLIAACLSAAAPAARAHPGTPFAPAPATGATYYVRADGGSAEQCTGLSQLFLLLHGLAATQVDLDRRLLLSLAIASFSHD